jgi:hypothetical protein
MFVPAFQRNVVPPSCECLILVWVDVDITGRRYVLPISEGFWEFWPAIFTELGVEVPMAVLLRASSWKC